MFLYGASDHAKVIIEIVESMGSEIEELFDDNESVRSLLNYPVRPFTLPFNNDNKLIVSIGNNLHRKKIATSLNVDFDKAIHPKAIISKRSFVGKGCVVMGGVTVNVGTHIGQHCIVNTNASIDHDCVLKDYIHVAPNAVLCGNVQVGEGTLIGAGAIVIPWIKIGKWCTIGAGSVVCKDVPDYATVVGNPAKIIKVSMAISC